MNITAYILDAIFCVCIFLVLSIAYSAHKKIINHVCCMLCAVCIIQQTKKMEKKQKQVSRIMVLLFSELQTALARMMDALTSM